MNRKDQKFKQVIGEHELKEIEGKLPKRGMDGTYGGHQYHMRTYKDLFPDREENRYVKERQQVDDSVDLNDKSPLSARIDDRQVKFEDDAFQDRGENKTGKGQMKDYTGPFGDKHGNQQAQAFKDRYNRQQRKRDHINNMRNENAGKDTH